MAVEVVDHLQVIEVEEDDAEERAVAARALHLFIEIRLEESAIECFRQIVAHGEIAAARQLINVAEDLRDGAEVTADGVSVGVFELVIARDRNADDADQIVVGAERHDHELRIAIDGVEIAGAERLLQQIGRNAGEKFAGIAR